ncbi:putative peptidyl-tRNA hydrolase PTRHD1 [Brevipalpus obovatus]|uniref:putative peptidyl-tRNA hydrolase PTRHD1 n=1 Tax=Brevipalpus obovatus TaxID=246614 RepID=UPI003D9F415D
MPIVQYIVVRGDLGWPLGALMAQACHASVAAITKFNGHENTKAYLDQLETMHKVVLKANEEQLMHLTKNFSDNNIDHYLWKEMPENIMSSLATRPYEKKIILPFVKHLKLFDQPEKV